MSLNLLPLCVWKLFHDLFPLYVKKVCSFNELLQIKLFVYSVQNKPLTYLRMSNKQF